MSHARNWSVPPTSPELWTTGLRKIAAEPDAYDPGRVRKKVPPRAKLLITSGSWRRSALGVALIRRFPFS